MPRNQMSVAEVSIGEWWLVKTCFNSNEYAYNSREAVRGGVHLKVHTEGQQELDKSCQAQKY
jgi:hypothetical protein